MDSSNPVLQKLAAQYSTVPDTVGLFQGQGLTLTAPQSCGSSSMQSVLQAGLAAGGVPASVNPAGSLYSHGTYGLTLAAPNSLQCAPGCLGFSPDPRSVKPLYSQDSYKLENVYSRGMY